MIPIRQVKFGQQEIFEHTFTTIGLTSPFTTCNRSKNANAITVKEEEIQLPRSGIPRGLTFPSLHAMLLKSILMDIHSVLQRHSRIVSVGSTLNRGPGK